MAVFSDGWYELQDYLLANAEFTAQMEVHCTMWHHYWRYAD